MVGRIARPRVSGGRALLARPFERPWLGSRPLSVALQREPGPSEDVDVDAGTLGAGGGAEGILADEYGLMNSDGKTFHAARFELESGEVMRDVQVRYQTWGQLNANRDNVMVVCHAMTGNAALDQWWGGLLGPGRVFDTDKYYVVCANVLGSCYGTTGPMDLNPAAAAAGHRTRYGSAFPVVTIRDTGKRAFGQ